MEPANKQFSKKFISGVIVLLIIMLIIAVAGISYRIMEFRKLRQISADQATINVEVIKAAAEAVNEEIVLPGNVSAWHEATIFARTNGYVVKWMVDIGAHVKKGDLLAVISAPEVNAQLRQTIAQLKTAQANYHIAHITAKRWRNLLKTDSVSKQETEEKNSNEKATAAIVHSTLANRDRLRDLVSYQRIVAPFDGVIMARNTDIGRLINAGSGTVPLFRLVQTNRLRIYVKIPQYYSTSITENFAAQLHFAEHPQASYTAKLFDTAKAIDPKTRTLLAEFVMDNTDEALLAGGYTEAHLLFPVNKNMVRLPVNTLIFRANGMQIATIDGDNKVLLKSITIGRDFGDAVEVVAGLQIGESIIINPPDSIFTGEKVRVKKS
jgi:RND family efflux transporter MFP subunit